MSLPVCEMHLVGKCQFGRRCLYEHTSVPGSMAKHLAVTVLVQRAWLRRVSGTGTAWTLVQALLGRLRVTDSLDVLTYDSEVSRAVDFEPHVRYANMAAVQEAVVSPHERFGPDRFFEPLAQTIAAIGAAAQQCGNGAPPVARQLVVFTYTGGVGDYSGEAECTRLESLMRAVNLRVIVVGIELDDEERRSLANLCAHSELFVFFDGKPTLTSCRGLAHLSARLHANTVLAAQPMSGKRRKPNSAFRRARAQFFPPTDVCT